MPREMDGRNTAILLFARQSFPFLCLRATLCSSRCQRHTRLINAARSRSRFNRKRQNCYVQYMTMRPWRSDQDQQTSRGSRRSPEPYPAVVYPAELRSTPRTMNPDIEGKAILTYQLSNPAFCFVTSEVNAYEVVATMGYLPAFWGRHQQESYPPHFIFARTGR
jgi:hypothetical protein